MTPTLAGILGFVTLFALLAIRMPIGLAMMVVGAGGIALLNSTTAALNNLGTFAYSYSAVYNPQCHSALRPNGQLRLGLRNGGGHVPHGLRLGRAQAGRAGGRDDPSLRRVRRVVGLVDRGRRDHGQGLPARDGALQVPPGARDGRHRGGRDARHPDPTVDCADRLRAPDRAIGGAAVPRGHPAGAPADGALRADGVRGGDPKPERGPAERADPNGGTLPGPDAVGRADLRRPHRDRRDLRWSLHRHRGRRRGGGADLPPFAVDATVDRRALLRGAARHR